MKVHNSRTLSFLKKFTLGNAWDSKPRLERTNLRTPTRVLGRRNRVLVKFLVQSNRVSALLTRNSEGVRCPLMMLQRCGDQATLSRPRVEFVYANPATVLGRKKTRTMTCTDSLSLSVSTQAKSGIPTALSNKVCVTTERLSEVLSHPREHSSQ